MGTVMVYSSRNNEDGTQPDNKMFWNAYTQGNEEFSYQLKMMEKEHKAIYQDIVDPPKKRINVDRAVDHPAYTRLEGILKSVYEKTGCVILEMFLYSAKAVPNLLPSDSIDRPFPYRDISGAYARMLAGLMDRSIREFSQKDRGNTADNPSISGYLHVLQSWPKTGTWNEIQRLAIRIYGEMEETSDEIEEELFSALRKIYNYHSAFDALISAEKHSHSKERLMTLLRFLNTRHNGGSQSIRRTPEMYRDFGDIIRRLRSENTVLYDELRSAYGEAKDTGIYVRTLTDIFELTEEDPLKELAGSSDEEKAEFIRTQYDPVSVKWRRWLENLDNVTFFNAVTDKFVRIIYPTENIHWISFALCGFAGMRNLNQGRNYIHKLSRELDVQRFSKPEALRCILFCARQLAGEPIEMKSILDRYEKLEVDEIRETRSTIKLLVNRTRNQEETKRRIRARIDEARYGDDNSIVELLSWLCKYYQMDGDHNLSQAIIPTQEVLNIIETHCRLDRDSSTFSAAPQFALLLASMNYIDGDITWENKSQYKSFLQAACRTRVRSRAENLLVTYFSSDIDG